ncbi:hypothetical protein AAF712_011874 [Marasmius tenuissimus]|uniref:Uncharacterized protein n=1 Tax=Marasmius tenuissimus TaxID=585030 RepID=A0ABR2ZIU8_9AGAR
MPPLPNQPGPRPLSRESVLTPRGSMRSLSSSIIGNTGYSTDAEEVTPDITTTGAKRDSGATKARSIRYSLATESLHSASASRASFDGTKSLPRTDLARLSTNYSLRLSRHSQRPEPSYSGSAFPSSNNLRLEQEEEEQPSDPYLPRVDHDVNTPPPNNGRSDDDPRTPASTHAPVSETPPSSNESHPPSSFPFPGGSQSAIARRPTATSNSTSVPPYSAGPYRERRDTITSNGTYETLPSYHSRRSTQNLADMGVPPISRIVRSLPPLPALPALPPFTSSSPILLGPSTSTSFVALQNSRPPASPEGEGGTALRALEAPEQ